MWGARLCRGGPASRPCKRQNRPARRAVTTNFGRTGQSNDRQIPLSPPLEKGEDKGDHRSPLSPALVVLPAIVGAHGGAPFAGRGAGPGRTAVRPYTTQPRSSQFSSLSPSANSAVNANKFDRAHAFI
jgi:hypothetical protein